MTLDTAVVLHIFDELLLYSTVFVCMHVERRILIGPIAGRPR